MNIRENIRQFSELRKSSNKNLIAPLFVSKILKTQSIVEVVRWDFQRMHVPLRGDFELLDQHIIYEPAVTEVLKALINEGNTVVDVGGHFGEHTLTMSRLVGKTGTVIAFEPSPETVLLLRMNSRPTSEGDVKSNILVKPYAVNDGSTSEVAIHQFPIQYSGLNTVGQPRFTSEHDANVPSWTEIVPAVSLDAFFSSRPPERLDFIKIDVENEELNVLNGAKSILEHFRPAVLFEGGMDHCKKNGESTHHCVALLSRLGYGSFVLGEHGNEEFDFSAEYPDTVNLLALPK